MCQVVGEGEDKEQSVENVGKHRVRENREFRTDESGKEVKTEEESCENKHENEDSEMEGSQEQIHMRLTLHH